MKELSIEEKAKAYDEAIKRASKLRVQNPFDTVSQMMEHVFPELKESEDEKIRKTLKHYLEVRRCQTQSDEEYINCNNFLAWLEKQGTSYTKKDVDDAFVEGMALAKKELEKQGEQKSVWTEEDEVLLSSIINSLELIEDSGANKLKIEWLKSIKQRMEEQL